MLNKVRYDIVIVGGGHNGLVASSYLAKAGLSVLVLERRPKLGGAAISRNIFPGLDVRLSEYAYLISLLPQKIIKDLGLNFRTERRKIASFTPILKNRGVQGLLLSSISSKVTRESLIDFTGSAHEYRHYQRFLRSVHILASRIWPTLLEPLISKGEMEKRFSDEERVLWRGFIEQPLGQTIEQFIHDDTLRGVIFTDAKIGILTYPNDPTLLQNRTFLYHVIGNGTGEWRVPVGGMGRLISELENCARVSGVAMKTNATVEQIEPSQKFPIVQYAQNGKTYFVEGKFILSNVAPTVLSRMITQAVRVYKKEIEGSLFKINLLLERLPKLKVRNYTSSDAFAGTFHLNEGYRHMQQTYKSALDGVIPDNPPADIYCHTLTDTSILSSGLKKAGYHTLTLFGLDIPYSLFVIDNEAIKQDLLKRYLYGINRFLAEPLEECIVRDQAGRLCIDVKSPVDIERDLYMPMGNIFHGELKWPFLEDAHRRRETWGVETSFDNIFVCGSGAQRGGCVSGIPGHNAAMKVLRLLKRK